MSDSSSNDCCNNRPQALVMPDQRLSQSAPLSNTPGRPMNPATSSMTELNHRTRPSIAIAVFAFLLILPGVLFYAILFHTALDVPFYDNYVALDFVNQLIQKDGLAAKLLFLFSSQFNEYKLVLLESIIWLQYILLGHVDFKVLGEVSNGFILPLAFLLWKISPTPQKNIKVRLALFIPVSWMLFQLQYYDILNFGGAGLQHIPSTLFAFGAIYFLFRKTRRAFYASLACFILAIASSGNGFLLLPIGILAFFPSRQIGRLIAWLITCGLCGAVYFCHYNVMSSRASADHSIFSALLRIRPAFVLSFIGSAVGIFSYSASFLLGIALCLFFAGLIWKGYIWRNPTVSSCILFLLLTAIGTAGIRSDLGLAASTPSRYTFFSALFLILAWFAIVEEYLQHRQGSLLNNGIYLCAVTTTIMFSLFMDAVGIVVIKSLNSEIIGGMTTFEHPSPADSTDGPDILAWKSNPELEAFNSRARAVLKESMRLGVYQPPKY